MVATLTSIWLWLCLLTSLGIVCISEIWAPSYGHPLIPSHPSLAASKNLKILFAETMNTLDNVLNSVFSSCH